MNPQGRAVEILERQADELSSAGDTAGARRMLAAAKRTAARARGEARDVTAQDLQAAVAAIERAKADLSAARAARDALILDAIADGWTYTAIGEVLGVSRSRVGQYLIAGELQ